MRVFFDTSAFVKRYVDEAGSEQVIVLCRRADSLVLSVLCLPEMISTLCRLVREGKISGDDYRQLREWLLDDLEDVDICEMTPQVMSHTLRCLETHSLRAMDAIHIGCALTVVPDLFVSADRRQLQAAQGEGLQVLEV